MIDFDDVNEQINTKGQSAFNDNRLATTLTESSSSILNNKAELNAHELEDETSNEDTSSFQNLFKLYDKENAGFITVERFIETTKEFMSSSWKDDDETINELIHILDPMSKGKINFDNFVEGIKLLTETNYSNNKIEENNNLLDLNNDQENYEKSASHVSINVMEDIEPKCNLSPYSNSNDTFNEYDTESQYNSMIVKQSNGLINNRDDLKITNSTSNSSNLTDLSYLIDEPNNFSSLEKSSSLDNNNNYANLVFDLINMQNSNNITGVPHTSSLVDTNSNNTNQQINDDPFGFFLVDDNNKSNKSNVFMSLDNNNNNQFQNKRLSYVSSKQIANGLFSNSSSLHYNNPNSNSNSAFEIINNNDSNSHNESTASNGKNSSTHSDNEDQLVEIYEVKVKELTNEIENLNMEKIEIVNKLGQLNSDNSNLLEKIRELEDTNIDQEKRYQQKLDSQELRHNDSMAKLLKTLEDEKYQHQAQLNNLDKELACYKEENSRYYNELNEITKKFELTNDKLNDETEKFAKLKLEHQRLVKENDLVKVELESERAKYKEKINILQSDLNESQLKLQQQSIRLRGYTVSINEESYLNNRIKELETELNQVKLDNGQLLTNNEDLKAQLLKNNLDNGRLLLHMTSITGGMSLAAEMDTMSKDDLMEKYKNEQQLTKRLRDYLEVILSKIMLHSPEILEVNTNGVPTNNTNTNTMNKIKRSDSKESTTSSTTKSNNKQTTPTGASEIFSSFRKNSDRIKFQF